MRKLSTVLFVVCFGILLTGFVSKYFEITKNLEIFNNIYRELEASYVEPINPGELMKKTIDGMLENLDPWTIYIPESDVEDYRERAITGNYGGIGSKIRKIDNFVVVAEPFQGSPADSAGLEIGDIILKINGQSVEGYSTEDVSDLLRGSADTKVEVKLKSPNGSIKSANITRKTIQTSTVPHYELLDNNVGYIKLTQFKRNSAKEVKSALKKLENLAKNEVTFNLPNEYTDSSKLSGLIFDLRNNGGGLLSVCEEIVNIFVPKNDTILIAKGKSQSWNKPYITKRQPLYQDLPVIVLINENSASASEIVAGCLQDLDRGVVMGRTSFGKGLIQQNQKIAYNTQLKLTVAKYYTPSGRCIQKIEENTDENKNDVANIFFTRNGRKVYGGGGIEPDIEINEKERLVVLSSLIRENCIFKFGNNIFKTIKFPESPKDFNLSDELYFQFQYYLEKEGFPFSVYSEEVIDLLEESLAEELYLENMENDIQLLKSSILANKKNDLNRHELEIRKLISNDLILRQFYRNGLIEYSLQDDIYIPEALKILNNKEEYVQILSPK